MSNIPSFCTCTDLDCAHHPSNHDKGCEPCISKNLKKDEIPTCFFTARQPDVSKRKDFSASAYAALVQASETDDKR